MALEKSIEPNPDEAAIVAVIEAETAAFLQRDIDALVDCWAKEPYVQHMTILPYVGMVKVEGFDKLRAHILTHFRVYDPPELAAEAVVRDNWQLIIRKNMAWATFDQVTASDEPMHMSGSQIHTRILEKTSGYWKLISSTGVLSRIDSYDGPILHVDASVKILHASKETQEVITRHPVLNISDGYLSAALEKDRITLRQAIQQAQREIDHGRARLPEPLVFEEETESDISLCWVAILDMKIVVLLKDVKVIDTKIETAAQIYGLSPMQTLVAAEIVKGKDLASISDTLEVSTNTVRTHVRRMFERVGVNNQKALLNRLLSAQSPAVGLQRQL